MKLLFALDLICCLFIGFILSEKDQLINSNRTFYSSSRKLSKDSDIHIGLTIDPYSIKDALLLINSIASSSINSDNLFFHIAAVEQSPEAATTLQSEIQLLFQSCILSTYPKIQTEILPFQLPATSGFALQLHQKLKNGKNKPSKGGGGGGEKSLHHWNSPLGTDMIRFYLPELFPTIPRLLYVDNDVIITCCLEEIYFSVMKEKEQVVGIALDDLHWATITQFRRHYNASHPLVIRHMRYNHSSISHNLKTMDHRAIEDQEFFQAVPRYPNDGVLLFNVPLYRKLKILEAMNEIATINSDEYVINLGTQQFTTLLMYDRWMELTPRANLRHFPNMARGYLMWFYYHGIIHYAGMFKPKLLCNLNYYKENFLRVMTFTPFIMNHFQLLQQCFQPLPATRNATITTATTLTELRQSANLLMAASHEQVVNQEIYQKYFFHQCPLDSTNHLLILDNLYELFIFIRLIAYLYNDDPYIYLRIGRFTIHKSADDGWNYEDYLQRVEKKYEFPLWKKRADLINSTFSNSVSSYLSSTIERKGKSDAFIQNYQILCQTQVHQEAAGDSSFVDLIDQLILFESIWSFRVYWPSSDDQTQKMKLSEIGQQHQYLEQSIETIPKTLPARKNVVPAVSATVGKIDQKKKKPAVAANERTFKIQSVPICQRPFATHYETTIPVTTSIASDQPQRLHCLDLLLDMKIEGRKHWEMAVIVISLGKGDTAVVFKQTEEIVYGLDLIFMRPKVILLEFFPLSQSTTIDLLGTLQRIEKYLIRQGYIPRHNLMEKKTCESGGRIVVYLWAVRINMFEL